MEINVHFDSLKSTAVHYF